MLLLVFVCLSGTALAQTITVTGTVTDQDGLPIPQVSVVIEGTTAGVLTDIEGKYRINVSSSEVTLEFRYVGFVTQKIKVGNRTVIDIVLEPDATQLDEVVVVGYGTQRKQDVSGALSTISGEDVSNVVTGNATQALIGRAPGVRVEVKWWGSRSRSQRDYPGYGFIK